MTSVSKVCQEGHAHLIPEIKKYAATELKAKVVTISEHAERMFPTAGDVHFAAGLLNVTPVKEPKYVAFDEAKSLFSKDEGFMTDYAFEGVGDTTYVAFQKALDSLVALYLEQLDIPLAYKANGTTLRFPIFGSKDANFGLPEYMAHHLTPDNKHDNNWTCDRDSDHEDADIMDIMEEDGEEDCEEDCEEEGVLDVLAHGQEVTYYRNGTPNTAKIIKVHHESLPPYYTIRFMIDGVTTERQTVREKLVASCPHGHPTPRAFPL